MATIVAHVDQIVDFQAASSWRPPLSRDVSDLLLKRGLDYGLGHRFQQPVRIGRCDPGLTGPADQVLDRGQLRRA